MYIHEMNVYRYFKYLSMHTCFCNHFGLNGAKQSVIQALLSIVTPGDGVCIYICIYICIYVYIYTYMYIYIYVSDIQMCVFVRFICLFNFSL
jgi:hypothetical protein